MEQLLEIRWELIAPLIVIQFVLLGIAMFDWAKAEEINGSRWVWFFVILLIGIIGPVLYFIFGRRQHE